MKKFFTVKNILLCGGIALFIGLASYIFIDNYTAYGSQNFRTMQDEISTPERINLAGLRELQASGGSAPIFTDLKNQLAFIKQRVIVFDTRNQTHGYVKGIPSKFFCYHRSPDLRHLPRRLIYTGTIENRPEFFFTEAEEAKKYGFDYVKISLGSRYITPDENVDAFVNFIDSLPDHTWLHFHCDRGKGRTSVALVMFDIMKNAPKITLGDIITRQHLLGSENLFDVSVWDGGSYSLEMLQNRKKFVEDFYNFICQRKAGGIQRWSEWQRSPLKVGETE
ncbi:MAG: hypothetical protein BGO67_12875 [Alphaproteobacteria bacterium 41-28]|nr:MAG: hypothetical protein BGO67_12875 [Alphaproteobacteria bacterium 41-28]